MDDKQRKDMYYEIEYDACPLPGVGKFVLKSQKVEQPKRDPIRELFYEMRAIARAYRPALYSSSKFYDKRVQKENAAILYRQGMMLQDFEDEYEKVVPYSSYYPNYQMMGYDQLRTYFTWRTKVRRGEIGETSLSYAYLYVYELLHQIGVADVEEGLRKLMDFWQQYRQIDASLDKYVLRWLKDYHIYYEMKEKFREFAERHELLSYYPEMEEAEDQFTHYCGISGYDLRKSKFFTPEREALIRSCFQQVLEKLTKVCGELGLDLRDSIFQPTKKMAVWEPFKDALFYPWLRQRDRKVVLSGKEIYVCERNQWSYSSVIVTESGRKLVGYVMKQLEAVLRKLTGYKYKLTADIDSVNHEAVRLLAENGLSPERLVTEAVTAAYREANKTVVRVDAGMLQRIREEALETQEKLTVPEEEAGMAPIWQETPAVKGMPEVIPERKMVQPIPTRQIPAQQIPAQQKEESLQTAPAEVPVCDTQAQEAAGPWKELGDTRMVEADSWDNTQILAADSWDNTQMLAADPGGNWAMP